MSQLNTSTFASISNVGGRYRSDVDGSRASAMISNAELVKRQIKGMAYHLDFLLYRKKSASSSSILRNAHECVESLDMHELSEATLRSLFDPLTPLPLGKDAGAISHESTSGGAAASLHMMQPEEAERENDREEEHFCSDSGVGEDESSGTVELLVKSELSLLLRVLHEVYYQAQLLYLESLHRSAGFKYCAVAVVVKSFILSLPQRERDGLDLKSLRPYLDSILASCLINASACRAYCGQYENDTVFVFQSQPTRLRLRSCCEVR